MSKNWEVNAILDCLFTSRHHPTYTIYHLIDSEYEANQIAVFAIDSDYISTKIKIEFWLPRSYGPYGYSRQSAPAHKLTNKYYCKLSIMRWIKILLLLFTYVNDKVAKF